MSDSSPSPPTPSHLVRWFPEFWEFGKRRLSRQARLLGLSLVLGVIAGIGAMAFHSACNVVVWAALDGIAGYHPHHPAGEPPMFAPRERPFSPWRLVVVAGVGGLISGLIVYSIAPEAEGHGTDAAIAAYHFRGGKIRPRVPLVKIFTSALTIGTGGSGGREGPIAQIGAGIGSGLGHVFRLGPSERRILVAAGMGAGVAAIFRAPLAGALFAAEILYRTSDFESEVVIPSALACVTAYCTFGAVFGWNPLFAIPQDVSAAMTFHNPLHLIPYTALAIVMAVLAMIYTRSFYGLTHWCKSWPMRKAFRPAIGSSLSAVLGLGLYFVFGRDTRVLSVLSFGYGTLQDTLNLPVGESADLSLAAVLASVAIGKILTTGLTIGSGGSGGVFGPSMVIGGCGGGAIGILVNWLWPGLAPHPACFVIVGMAGFFAAAGKTPLSTLVIVSEMTGGYGLLLPTLWVCVLSFLLSDEQSLYHSQVDSRSRSPAHQGDYVREVLAGMTVRQFLDSPVTVAALSPQSPLAEIVRRLGNSPFHGLPVIDSQGGYLGVVSLEEVHLASQSPHLGTWIMAEDLMRTDIEPLTPDQSLDLALELFIESDRHDLPVVDSAARRVIGIVKRSDISTAYLQRVHGTSPEVESVGELPS